VSSRCLLADTAFCLSSPQITCPISKTSVLSARNPAHIFFELSPSEVRIHFLDAMRSTLMALGVVLHTANVYAVHGKWEIHDSCTHPVFDLLAAVIRSFRMPAFFIIAGFFAQMTIDRHGAHSFLSQRAKRLMIPFVTTTLTLNLLQFWLQYRYHAAVTGIAWQDPSVLLQTFFAGNWIQHLWFLNVLGVYCLIAVPASGLLRRTSGNIP
jgi:glucan biosynthesis protein C